MITLLRLQLQLGGVCIVFQDKGISPDFCNVMCSTLVSGRKKKEKEKKLVSWCVNLPITNPWNGCKLKREISVIQGSRHRSFRTHFPKKGLAGRAPAAQPTLVQTYPQLLLYMEPIQAQRRISILSFNPVTISVTAFKTGKHKSTSNFWVRYAQELFVSSSSISDVFP